MQWYLLSVIQSEYCPTDDLRQEIADDEARWVEEMQEELFN
jgi:hypothetical protein